MQLQQNFRNALFPSIFLQQLANNVILNCPTWIQQSWNSHVACQHVNKTAQSNARSSRPAIDRCPRGTGLFVQKKRGTKLNPHLTGGKAFRPSVIKWSVGIVCLYFPSGSASIGNEWKIGPRCGPKYVLNLMMVLVQDQDLAYFWNVCCSTLQVKFWFTETKMLWNR